VSGACSFFTAEIAEKGSDSGEPRRDGYFSLIFSVLFTKQIQEQNSAGNMGRNSAAIAPFLGGLGGETCISFFIHGPTKKTRQITIAITTTTAILRKSFARPKKIRRKTSSSTIAMARMTIGSMSLSMAAR
jgi:hypothetical protein